MKMLMASGYRFPQSSNVTRTISKAEAVSSVGNVLIKVLGSGNPLAVEGAASEEAEVLETWTLKNPWVKSVTMGDLDYTSDDVLSMDVTLRYDWATLSIPKLDNQLDPSNNVGETLILNPELMHLQDLFREIQPHQYLNYLMGLLAENNKKTFLSLMHI